jgi:hypothetical protein
MLERLYCVKEQAKSLAKEVEGTLGDAHQQQGNPVVESPTIQQGLYTQAGAARLDYTAVSSLEQFTQMVRTYLASDASYQDHSKLAYEADRMAALCHHIAKEAQGMAEMEDNHPAATHVGPSRVNNSPEHVQLQRPASPSALDSCPAEMPAQANDSNMLPSETTAVNPAMTSQSDTSTGEEEKPNVNHLMYTLVSTSKDKLFFLKIRQANSWRLAQVDLEHSDLEAAKVKGDYQVRWWTPSLDQRITMRIQQCKFMPDVRVAKPNRPLGHRTTGNPRKIDQWLQHNPHLQWITDTANLQQESIVGPFDFTTAPKSRLQNAKKRKVMEGYHVSDETWLQLAQRGPHVGVDTSTITAIVPDPEAF